MVISVSYNYLCGVVVRRQKGYTAAGLIVAYSNAGDTFRYSESVRVKERVYKGVAYEFVTYEFY